MQTITPRQVIDDYLAAFQARDLPRCLDMYQEDATLEFPPATYQGRKALEDWHKARFAANLQVVRIDDISVDGDTVRIEAVISSKRLQTWRIGNLAGHGTFRVRDAKIVDARFGPKNDNLLQMLRA